MNRRPAIIRACCNEIAFMIPASFRTVLSLVAAFLVGVLVTWGLFERFSTKPAEASVSTTSPAPQVAASTSPTPPAESFVAEVKPSPTPSVSASPESQENGFPSGVTQSALNYNKELYKKYPGLQPPVINTDGRDLGQEALQRMQGPPTVLTNPGGVPLAPATPASSPAQRSLALPFPLLNGSASPTPTASNQ